MTFKELFNEAVERNIIVEPTFFLRKENNILHVIDKNVTDLYKRECTALPPNYKYVSLVENTDGPLFVCSNNMKKLFERFYYANV